MCGSLPFLCVVNVFKAAVACFPHKKTPLNIFSQVTEELFLQCHVPDLPFGQMMHFGVKQRTKKRLWQAWPSLSMVDFSVFEQLQVAKLSELSEKSQTGKCKIGSKNT